MTGNRKRKNRRTLNTEVRGHSKADTADAVEAKLLDEKINQRLVVIVSVLLLVFGIYHSVLLYGFAPSPHPDSVEILDTGHELISFQVPTSFKRAPVLCLLQAGLSNLLRVTNCDVGPPGTYDMHSGWLINSVLHPLSVVLLWLVGRRMIGNAAAFLAILLSMNPWELLRTTEGIIETPLLFFSLLTIYLIMLRSKWAYVLASVTMMTRYDTAGLVPAVLVLDLINGSSRRERCMSFVWAGLAILPLGLWLLATKLAWRPGSGGHYFNHYKNRQLHVMRYLGFMWHTSVYPLLVLPTTHKAIATAFILATKIATAVTFSAGIVYGIIKRRWIVLAFLIFIVTYNIPHWGRDSVKDRYYAPLACFITFICILGLQGLWQLIKLAVRKANWKRIPPTPILIIAHLVVIATATVWFFRLLPHLSPLKAYSPRTTALPYVGMAAVAVIFIVRRILYSRRWFLRDLTIAAVVFPMLVSNHFSVARYVGDGQRDVEFVQLVDWFRHHAKPGEKIVTSLSQCMRVRAPDLADSFVHMYDTAHDNPAAFALDCLAKGITYVAWDSRISSVPSNWYYKKLHLDKTAMLRRPQSIAISDPSEAAKNGRPKPVAYYEYLTRMGSKYRYIHVFRLRSAKPTRHRIIPTERARPVQ